MSIKHSIAQKKRWSKVSKKKKSEMMSKVAKIGQAKLSKEKKRKNALELVRIRKNKIKK